MKTKCTIIMLSSMPSAVMPANSRRYSKNWFHFFTFYKFGISCDLFAKNLS